MGTIAAKPEPAGRTNRVEQEILRCAAIGETADFTGQKWSRVKRVDGRAVVSGKFLADLWLGLHETRVHPVGIAITGVHIDGTLALGGARVDARLRAPLVGLSAKDCRFDAGLELGNARVESLYFLDSEFAGDLSLWANSIEVVGQLHFIRCKFEGFFSIRNAVVDDDFNLSGCALPKGIAASGSEIRGNLLINGAQMGVHGQGATVAVDLFDVEVSGNIEIARCRLEGAISASQARASSVYFGKIKAAGPHGVLNMQFCQIAHNVRIMGSRFRGGVDFFGGSIGGQFYSHRSVFGEPGSPVRNLRMASASVKTAVLIDQCRVHSGILASNLKAGQLLRLSGSSVPCPGANLVAGDFSNHTAGKVEISNCFVAGALCFDNSEMTRFVMTDCTVDLTGRPRRSAAPYAKEVNAVGLSLYAAKIGQDLVISTMQQGGASCIDGGVSLQAMEAGGQVSLRFCWLGRESMAQSVMAWGLKAARVFEVLHCVLPAGLNSANLETADFRMKSSVVSASNAEPRSAAAVSLQAAKIGDSFFIGSDNDEPDKMLQVSGTIDAADCQIGNSVTISGLNLGHSGPPDPAQWAGGISFAGSQLGNVYLGLDNEGAPETRILGCIAFDRAKCLSVQLYPRLTITARCKAGEATFSQSVGKEVLRNKWGVALSLVGASTERLRIERPALQGMVDCKNLSANQIADSAGEAWLQAGIAPGQLRLDGMTYDDLDDDQLASNEPRKDGGSTAHPMGAVARRLDWLAMQYPGGTPDAASFVPQPYEQLARHYAAMGDERARRQVLVRKRQIQRLHSGLGWIERAVSGLLGLTSDYGYSPGKASAATLILVLLGTIAAWGLYAAGAIVPENAEQGSAAFSPLLYAIDVAVPFLDLGHDGDWSIDPGKLAYWPGQTLALGLAEALYRLAGLVMLSITVLTFSGILHEKE